MKRPLLFAAISLVAVLLLAGCGGSPAAEEGASTLQATETNGETNDLGEQRTSGVVWQQMMKNPQMSTNDPRGRLKPRCPQTTPEVD